MAPRHSVPCCTCHRAWISGKPGTTGATSIGCLIDMVRGTGAKGTIASIVQFNRRIAPPGTRYYYASIEADVLGMVLHHAVNRSASDYLHEKAWEPIGAEADAA
jgi:CubicO group peptidase (beta-lactamase class C family)